MTILSKTWDFFVEWACTLSRARAAAELTRQGQHDAARALISGRCGCDA